MQVLLLIWSATHPAFALNHLHPLRKMRCNDPIHYKKSVIELLKVGLRFTSNLGQADGGSFQQKQWSIVLWSALKAQVAQARMA